MPTKLIQHKLDIKSLTLIMIEAVRCGDERTGVTNVVIRNNLGHTMQLEAIQNNNRGHTMRLQECGYKLSETIIEAIQCGYKDYLTGAGGMSI